MRKLKHLCLLSLLALSASAQVVKTTPHKPIQNNHLEHISSSAVYAQKQDSETPLKMALPRLKGEAADAHRVADAGAITPEPGKTGAAPAKRPRPGVEGQTPDNLEEVRVTGVRVSRSATATNTSAPLIETPATVNVLTRDFLGAIGARRIEEALQYVPGASAESVNASGTAFNIRGFSTQVFGGGASGEGSVQIDNYRTAGRRYHFDPALYERIDVLKGAAALLYGTADPGGVARYVSKKPQFERLHRFETTLGSFDTMRGTLDLTGPLGKGDQAAYRLIATGLNSNQPFHGGNDDISFDDRRIINPQLAWRTPGGGELNLSYEYSQHKSTLDPGIKRLASGAFTFNTKPFLGPDSFLDRAHHIGVAQFAQPIAGNWEILVGGKMGRSRLDYLWDAGFGSPDANNRLNRFTSPSNARLQHEEIRAQLAGQFNTGALLQHQVTVGDPANPGFFILAGVISARAALSSRRRATLPARSACSVVTAIWMPSSSRAEIRTTGRTACQSTRSRCSGNTSSRGTLRDGAPASALSMSANVRGTLPTDSNCRPMSAWTPL